jgi:hypothetical protein
MNSKRFMPCAALVLGLLALGGQVFGDQAHLVGGIMLAVLYILISLLVLIMCNRIASWWSSSIVLPCGCAALLLVGGVNALARVEWRQATQIYTRSSRPLTSATSSRFIL